MDPDYEKKLREAEEWDRERKDREARDKKKVKVPNMERMPCGCWMWVIALAVGILYLAKKSGMF